MAKNALKESIKNIPKNISRKHTKKIITDEALRYYSRLQHGGVFAQMPGFCHKSDNAGY